ncbi:MAG: proteasome assembly chaperone family protein [Haloarculaceae archaeon]
MSDSGQHPAFTVRSESPGSDTLLCGFSEFGLAGLTAVDYLVKQLDLEQVGHVTVDRLPTITPFENGTPRHHSRLFTRDDLDVTVLVGELLVPPFAADAFASELVDRSAAADTEEIVILSGVPVAHGPDEHRAFHVSSPDYQAAHDLAEHGIEGMVGGYLDGINGAITARGLDSTLRTCVFTTPAHARTPDAEAALRLIGAVESVYGFGIDTAPLEGFAADVSRHYEELAERIAEAAEESVAEDRMYM